MTQALSAWAGAAAAPQQPVNAGIMDAAWPQRERGQDTLASDVGRLADRLQQFSAHGGTPWSAAVAADGERSLRAGAGSSASHPMLALPR
jgi:hypothetical protein